jgi:ABC-2 type transport system ATP-binding protein
MLKYRYGANNREWINMSGIPAVELINVTKRYGELVAVNKANLTIETGEIFALLGPNGSGKSTTLKMLMGLLQPTEGSVQVLGLDVQKDPIAVKKQVGYVPESPDVYEFLTGIEYLDFIGDIYGVPAAEKKQRITEYLKALQLEGREGDMINSYSDGMKKKISLISAFLHKPAS